MSSTASKTETVCSFNFGFYQEHKLYVLIKCFSPQRVVFTVAILENIGKLFSLSNILLNQGTKGRKTPRQQLLDKFHKNQERSIEQSLRNNLSLWRSPPTAAFVFFKERLNCVTPLALLKICEQTVLNSCRAALGFRHCDAIEGSPDTGPEMVPRRSVRRC